MPNNEIATYNEAQSDDLLRICNRLCTEISAALTGATAKLYHANPVWFIHDNPIVGYDVAKDNVNILFWSGQSFEKPGLSPKGKHKAAGRAYRSVRDIDVDTLRAWLEESKTIQWNYNHIRQNNGILNKLII